MLLVPPPSRSPGETPRRDRKPSRGTHMTRLCILLAFTIASVAPVSAQQATPPARKVTIVHAGELLDRPGQKLRGNSTIIIEDGKIAEVRDGFAPADAQAHRCGHRCGVASKLFNI